MQVFNNDQNWHVHHGDCIPHMLQDMPEESVDFAIFSPPFPALYAYLDSVADIGNVDAMGGEAAVHLSFMFNGLYRVLKPGRVAIVHVAQIPRMKRSGGVGLCDFRGTNIRIGERSGLTFEYDWMVRKNPQALRHGSKIVTPNGMVSIEDLEVGSRVIGSNGKSTRVKGVYHHGKRQMYKVTFSDGVSIECDGMHLWQVETKKGPSKTMTTNEIREFGTHPESGEPRFRIPIVSSSVEFAVNQDLPIDPYTLGVILGDGAITSRSSAFLTCEHEIVEMATVPDGHSWRRIKGSDKGNGTVATYATNGPGGGKNYLLEALRSIGVFGLRAWEKHVPSMYLMASPYDRLELLRGLMDTDGTVKTRNGIVAKFCSTSEALADAVIFLAQSLGGVARKDTEDNSKYKHKGEVKVGRRKYLVSLRMPDGCNPFKMARKADRWKPTKKAICRWIKSIEPTTIEECTCIEVEAKDHLYVADNFIVTHNSQALRTRSRELQFAGLESDRAASRGTLQDYLIKFRKPGVNAVPVRDWEQQLDDDGDAIGSKSTLYPSQVTRNDWIKFAEGCWDDIQETDTLNTAAAKSEDDTRHICPLQLEVIRRCVLLYTNPGEIVFSPFTGIGSEGYMSLGGKSPKTGKMITEPRRFYGCELKPEYHKQACVNLDRAVSNASGGKQKSLFVEV